MPKSELLQLVENRDLPAFESRCLELLSEGTLRAGDLVQPIQALIAAGENERVRDLAPMMFEAVQWEADAPGGVQLVKTLQEADPDNENLRQHLIDAYTRAYGDHVGFDQIMTASGLTAGRAFRNACKVLDLGFNLEPGDCLINRMDDHAAEVVEIDRPNGLFTLRRGSRRTTIPAAELARTYDQVDKDDFRVLRQLHADRLSELIEKDPVALVTGLIHAHGEHIDQDMLRDELVPRYLDAKAWSKWWTAARKKLKRARHIVIEGRSPVVLSYSAAGQSLEDETRDAFAAAKEPAEWQGIIEGYLREKQSSREEPDRELLGNLTAEIAAHIEKVRALRPAEALEAALVLAALQDKGLPAEGDGRALAAEMLREAQDPVRIFRDLSAAGLWDAALDALQTARPEEYAALAARLMEHASANVLDRLVADALAGDQRTAAQKWIEQALDSPIDYPEIIYWLWKGPKRTDGLHIPSDELLLNEVLDTLLALGRTLNPPVKAVRDFKARVRAALALRDYERIRALFQTADIGRGITLKGQLSRMDALGPNAQSALLNILRDVHPSLWIRPVAKRLEPWEDPDILWNTRQGIERREAERDELVNVTMRENAQRIGEAASLGDLSENSEYKFALEERDLLRARLAQMNNELSIAQPIDPRDIPTEYIGVGSRVTLRCPEDGDERTLSFLGPFDADSERGLFNYRAPVAQQLMGHRVGDRIDISFDKQDRTYEVISISNGMEALSGGH